MTYTYVLISFETMVQWLGSLVFNINIEFYGREVEEKGIKYGKLIKEE
jgi:hypothetical protein